MTTPKETKNVRMDLTIRMSKQSIMLSECVQNSRISDIPSRIKKEETNDDKSSWFEIFVK